MVALVTRQGIDQAINSLGLKKHTLKAKLLNILLSRLPNDIEQEFVPLSPDEIIPLLWKVKNESGLKAKRKNLSTLKSAINKDLKEVDQAGHNSEGIVIGRDYTFTISEERKNSLIEQLDITSDTTKSLLEMFSTFKKIFSGMVAEGKDADIQALLNELEETRKIVKGLAGETLGGDHQSKQVIAEQEAFAHAAYDDRDPKGLGEENGDATLDFPRTADNDAPLPGEKVDILDDIEIVAEPEEADEAELDEIEEVEEIDEVEEVDEVLGNAASSGEPSDIVGETDRSISDQAASGEDQIDRGAGEEDHGKSNTAGTGPDKTGAGSLAHWPENIEDFEEIDEREFLGIEEMAQDRSAGPDTEGLGAENIPSGTHARGTAEETALGETIAEVKGNSEGTAGQITASGEAETLEKVELIEAEEVDEEDLEILEELGDIGEIEEEVEPLEEVEEAAAKEEFADAPEPSGLDPGRGETEDTAGLSMEQPQEFPGELWPEELEKSEQPEDLDEIEEIDEHEFLEVDEDILAAAADYGEEPEFDNIWTSAGNNNASIQGTGGQGGLEDAGLDGAGKDSEGFEQIPDDMEIETLENEDIIEAEEVEDEELEEKEIIDEDNNIEAEEFEESGTGGFVTREGKSFPEDTTTASNDTPPKLLEVLSRYIDPDEALVDPDRLLSEPREEYIAQILERFTPKFIKIPSGHFIIGSSNPQGVEQTKKKISLPSYHIGQFPVTNDLFELFVRDTGYETDAEKAGCGTVIEGRCMTQIDPVTGRNTVILARGITQKITQGANWRHPFGPGSSLGNKHNHPVVQVSRRDAMAFAAWAGKRLPTEEEWETAARGADERLFPWGNQWDERLANLESSGQGDTTPVNYHSRQSISPFGIFDLLGNVWEWTATVYRHGQGETGNKRGGSLYILKGGCWATTGVITAAARLIEKELYWSSTIGFRCVV